MSDSTLEKKSFFFFSFFLFFFFLIKRKTTAAKKLSSSGILLGNYTWDSFRCRSDASRKPLASIWLSRSLSSSRYLQWGARHNRSLLLLLSVKFYHRWFTISPVTQPYIFSSYTLFLIILLEKSHDLIKLWLSFLFSFFLSFFLSFESSCQVRWWKE